MAQPSPKHKPGKKLQYFLNALEDQEKDRFLHFLDSPLIPNQRDLSGLLEAVYLQSGESWLDPKKLYATFRPGEAWQPDKLPYLQLRLAQLLEKLMDFLAHQKYLQDPVTPHHYLLDSFMERGLTKYLDSTYRKGLKLIAEPQESRELREQYRFQSRMTNFKSDFTTDGSYTGLEEVLQTLDHYYYLEKLKYATAALNAELAWGKKIEIGMLQPVLEAVEKQESSLPDVIVGYRLACLSLKNVQEAPETGKAFFLRLKQLLLESENLPKGETLDLFTYGLNYAILRWYKAPVEFGKHLSDLYTRLLEKGLLLENGKLPPAYYKNITALMCKMEEVDWAAQFVEEWKDRVGGKDQELLYRYNLAVVNFHKQNYKALIPLLYNELNQFSDILYGMAARVYLSRALWLLEEYDMLGQVLSAFHVYMKRNLKVVDREKKLHLNFIAIFQKLLRTVTGNPDQFKENLKRVRKSLESAPGSAVFQWLRSVMEELEVKGQTLQ